MYNTIREVVKDLDKKSYNITEIKSMMQNWVDEALGELIKEKHTIVTFNSPLGADSKVLLKRNGYSAEWYGQPGLIGETVVYLKKPVKKGAIPKLMAFLEEQELIDDFSHIKVD